MFVTENRKFTHFSMYTTSPYLLPALKNEWQGLMKSL